MKIFNWNNSSNILIHLVDKNQEAFKTNIEMKLIKDLCSNNKKKASKADQKKRKINDKNRNNKIL